MKLLCHLVKTLIDKASG